MEARATSTCVATSAATRPRGAQQVVALARVMASAMMAKSTAVLRSCRSPGEPREITRRRPPAAAPGGRPGS
eukprot:494831-Alexandrium_andersonii.AAC.1